MTTSHRIERSLSAYLDGELPPEEVAEVERHLAECPSCRAELDDLRATVRILKLARTPEAPDDLEELILARAGRRRWLTWPTWPKPAVALAAVALAVILVATPLLRGHRDRLRAAEVSPDVFIRAAVQSAADDPFMDRAYIGLVSSDTNLRLIGEEPRGSGR